MPILTSEYTGIIKYILYKNAWVTNSIKKNFILMKMRHEAIINYGHENGAEARMTS